MAIPGLEFRPRGRRAEPSPVHSDVAGFIGRTRRGPVGQAIRVEGWRRFVRLFGDLDADIPFTYALRGYFENGGKIAYIVRVAGGVQQRAGAEWTLPIEAGAAVERQRIQTARGLDSTALDELLPLRFLIRAGSPGVWGRKIAVTWDWTHENGRLIVSAPGERTEYHADLNARITTELESEGRGTTIRSRIELESDLIELQPLPALAEAELTKRRDSIPLKWQGEPVEARPTVNEYLAAMEALGDEPEVALLAVPGLCDDLRDEKHPEKDVEERNTVRLALMQQAYELQDRLVLIDPPDASAEVVRSVVNRLRSRGAGLLRSCAVYGPWLRVPDPLGGVAAPLKTVPASGHVAGIISRLDRERGAHHTPANVSLLDAVDLEKGFRPEEEIALIDAGMNLIRCQPGRGLMVWGGRTLDPDDGAKFVAHRRLIHRLVRAIRRVAEPIVFDGNTPALWLAFTRAITTVLLAAFRAGALKGERPEEGFKVECNEQTNPTSEQDLGRVICLISLAPAVPMEFISLRVALSEDKQIEVFDT